MTGRPRKVTSRFKPGQMLWWKLRPEKVEIIAWDKEYQMYHVKAFGDETHMHEHELSEDKPTY